jgi:DNA-3-methyladenine glycosylase II
MQPERPDVKPSFWDSAKRSLARRDPVMAGIMRAHPKIFLVRRGAPFTTLARAIVGQQISVKAAQSVWERFAACVGEVTPENVLLKQRPVLRACGLSDRKTEYIADLAQHFANGSIHVHRWPQMSDEGIIAELVEVRGIGRWTAEMYLMFELRRLDVWPVEDFGVRQGYGLAWGLQPPPTARQLQPLGDRFRPYRSVVARYCWEAVVLARHGTDPALR